MTSSRRSSEEIFLWLNRAAMASFGIPYTILLGEFFVVFTASLLPIGCISVYY
jgi:hypothetical protein